jgi:hypothetical protein
MAAETKTLVDIADKLGLIQAVKGKLIKQPDPAADKLVIVLEEISKMHTAVDEEIGKYLGLWFDPANTQLQKGRETLIDLEGDKIKARVGKARGSCETIKNIYDRYLNPWFQRVLSFSENEMMLELFKALGQYDDVMMEATEKLAEWLGPKATETLDRVDSDDWQGANELIRSARKEILPVRQKVSGALSELYRLQAEFVEISGALGNK